MGVDQMTPEEFIKLSKSIELDNGTMQNYYVFLEGTPWGWTGKSSWSGAGWFNSWSGSSSGAKRSHISRSWSGARQRPRKTPPDRSSSMSGARKEHLANSVEYSILE